MANFVMNWGRNSLWGFVTDSVQHLNERLLGDWAKDTAQEFLRHSQGLAKRWQRALVRDSTWDKVTH